MLFRFENLAVNKAYTDDASKKTHILTFRAVGEQVDGLLGPGLTAGSAMIVLPLTEAEAAQYTLGFEYAQELREFPTPGSTTPAVVAETKE